MLQKSIAATLSSIVLLGCAEESGEVASRSTLTASEAGSLFGEVCIDEWPNVEAEKVAAQNFDALVFDPSSGLYSSESRELQFRINEDRCAIRFLTDTPAANILVEFGNASTPPDDEARVARVHGENIVIGTETEAGGFVRVGVTRRP